MTQSYEKLVELFRAAGGHKFFAIEDSNTGYTKGNGCIAITGCNDEYPEDTSYDVLWVDRSVPIKLVVNENGRNVGVYLTVKAGFDLAVPLTIPINFYEFEWLVSEVGLGMQWEVEPA